MKTDSLRGSQKG